MVSRVHSPRKGTIWRKEEMESQLAKSATFQKMKLPLLSLLTSISFRFLAAAKMWYCPCKWKMSLELSLTFSVLSLSRLKVCHASQFDDYNTQEGDEEAGAASQDRQEFRGAFNLPRTPPSIMALGKWKLHRRRENLLTLPYLTLPYGLALEFKKNVAPF